MLDMSDICCSWTWYLGCEMQFFVLFTALLLLYAKNAKAAKIVFATLALGFVVTGWICNYHSGITFHIDKVYSTLNELYVKPWVRINPYIGGAALGWLLHQQQKHSKNSTSDGQRQQLDRTDRSDRQLGGWAIVAFWLLCTLLYVATNFMSYWRAAPVWLVATIMSLGKLLFALCVGGVIVLWANGQGGHFNRLLSARPFLLLNKFCFSIYMVAPVIVFAVFGLRREATHFSEIGSGMDFLAVILLSIAVAFLFVLLVELPMQRVTKLLLTETRMQSNNNHPA